MPWNAYIYVVGTDVSGSGDFNVMRQLLQRNTTYEYPWVAVTYDFKKGEGDPRQGELRKTWKRSASDAAQNQVYQLGTSFDIVYEDINKLQANNQQIRHLHFLSHFGNDAIWYRPQTSSTVSDLRNTANSTFKSAFAPNAIVKIHGCQVDDDIKEDIRDFCSTSSGQRRKDILATLRDRIKESYPFQLAQLINQPVWATPIGAYAVYSCSYLPSGEKGKRFCIEADNSSTHSFQRTLRFYEANYSQLFTRASGELVFDATYHMKYKVRLRNAANFAPAPCASSVPPRGT